MATKTGSTIVGALACQKDSFLKSLKTTVLSCEPHKGHVTSKDKQNKTKKSKDEKLETRYAVELQDTVIFPEGGGQPSDVGYIESSEEKVEVVEAIRDKLTALHLTHKPLSPGTEVNLSIDWARRFDHMQQHTGQHLVSAIFDQYNLETLSWSMGETFCYIELPRKVEDDILKEANEKINQAILDAIPITAEVPDGHGHEIDTSHIPEDYDLSQGLLRIVRIGNLDRNPCCGTHLKNTAQIQTITLLHQVGVRGGNSRLYFVSGARAFRYMSKTYDILKNTAGNVLSCQIEEVYDKVKLLNDNYKEASSSKRKILTELFGIEANRIVENFKNGSKVEWFYRKDSNPESITLFFKELLTAVNANKESGIDLDKSHTVVIFNGLPGEGGMIKIVGPESPKLQEEIKKILTTIKGGGKGSSFQGKITKFEKGEIESLTNYLDNLDLAN